MPDAPIPNPGSDEARTLGCHCPVLDNNHGRRPPSPWGYWVNEGCPVHSPWEVDG